MEHKITSITSINRKDVEQLLDEMDIENIGFLFDLNETQHFSCSCGCFSSWENIKERKCPNCGTSVIHDINDIMDDSIILKNTFYVIQEDENFLVLKLGFIGATMENTQMLIDNYENDEGYLFLDKINRKFGIIDYESCFPENISFTNNIHYEKDEIYDGEELVAKFIDGGDFFYPYHFDYDFCYETSALEYSGIIDIYRKISEHIHLDISLADMDCIISLINTCFMQVNIGYYDDFERLSKRYSLSTFSPKKRYGYHSTFNYCEQMKEIGVDISAKTIEEAFGLTAEELDGLKSINDYVEKRTYLKKIRECNLEEYISLTMANVDLYYKNKILNFAETANENAETIFKHFARSIQQGYDLRDVLTIEENILSTEFYHILNFKKPYTYAIFKKYMFLKSELLTEEQLDSIQNKPTFDNVMKIISNNK